jgi:hypothetical protein
MASIYERSGAKAKDERKAKDTSAASELAAESKINTGLGDLIKKTTTPTPTPMPSMSVGEPKRADFPPGLGGQGEYNRALTAWKAKSTKPVSGGKSLGGSR